MHLFESLKHRRIGMSCGIYVFAAKQSHSIIVRIEGTSMRSRVFSRQFYLRKELEPETRWHARCDWRH